jgi:hypothetical protein
MANTDYLVENLWKTCGKIRGISGKLCLKIPSFSTKIFNNFFNITFNTFSTIFSTAKNQYSQGKQKFSIKNQEVLFISRKYLYRYIFMY